VIPLSDGNGQYKDRRPDIYIDSGHPQFANSIHQSAVSRHCIGLRPDMSEASLSESGQRHRDHPEDRGVAAKPIGPIPSTTSIRPSSRTSRVLLIADDENSCAAQLFREREYSFGDVTADRLCLFQLCDVRPKPDGPTNRRRYLESCPCELLCIGSQATITPDRHPCREGGRCLAMPLGPFI
jgi:hypothetical protein